MGTSKHIAGSKRENEALRQGVRPLREAGLKASRTPGALDRRGRATQVPLEGDGPVALALRHGGAVRGDCTPRRGARTGWRWRWARSGCTRRSAGCPPEAPEG